MQVMGVELEDNDRKVLTYDANCPRHYLGDGFITATRAMRSAIKQWKDEFTHSAIIVWWWCCAFKYVWRCLSKGQALSDIDKAIDCLRKLRKEIEPCAKSKMNADCIMDGKGRSDREPPTLEELMKQVQNGQA